jgi:hypothetical protein
VLVVIIQVAAQVDRTAIRDTDRTISPLADPAAAFDADQTALADGVAGAAVLQARLEIDTDPAAVSQTTGTLRRACPATASVVAGLARGTGKAACPAVVLVAPEIGAVAFDALRDVRSLAAIGPS